MEQTFLSIVDGEFNVLNPDIFFEARSPNITKISHYERVLSKIEDRFTIDYQDIFSQNQILGFQEGYVLGTDLGVSIVLSPFFTNLTKFLGLNNLNKTQGVLIYDNYNPFSSPEQNISLKGSIYEIEIKSNVSYDEFSELFPLSTYILGKTGYKFQIILPPLFFYQEQKQSCFVIGAVNLEKKIRTNLLWSSKGKQMYDSIRVIFSSELKKEEIFLEDELSGHISQILDSTQLIVMIVGIIIEYLHISILVLTIVALSYTMFNLLSKNKEIEFEFYLISTKQRSKLLWILEALSITLIGFILGLAIATIIFFFFSLMLGFNFLITQQTIQAFLKNYYSVQAIVAAMYLLSRTRMISQLKRKKMNFSRTLVFSLVLSVVILVITLNYYATFAVYSLFSLAFITIALSYSLYRATKWLLKKINSKFNLIKKTPSYILLFLGFKKNLKRKIFLLTFITFVFFSLVFIGSKANRFFLDFQIWENGGEIKIKISGPPNQNISKALDYNPLIEKTLPVIEIRSTKLGTEETVLTNELNILSFNWNQALNYFGEEYIKKWLGVKTVPTSLEDSVLLSKDYEKLGFSVNSEFQIFFFCKHNQSLSHEGFNVASFFNVWPLITSNTYNEETSISKQWIILPIESTLTILNTSETEFSTSYLIRTDVKLLSETIRNLKKIEMISEINAVDYSIINIYQTYILPPIVVGLLSIIPIWLTLSFVSDAIDLEERRTLAFVALSKNPSPTHVRFRLVECLLLIGYTVILMLLLNLVIFYSTAVYFTYYSMELTYSSLSFLYFIYPFLGCFLSIIDYLRLRGVEPAATLRHFE
ncbi:MAG: hypothetical protein ACTSUR_01675 [Candidatus Heimdallarchaeaceae archaeon]